MNGGSANPWLLNGGGSFQQNSGPAVYINGYGTGTNANRSNLLDNILVEGLIPSGFGGAYNCGIKLHNAEENTITNSSYYDGLNNSAFLCGDSTAIKSRVTSSNYVDVLGTLYTDATWSANNDMPYRTVNFSFDGGGISLTGTTARCSPPLPFGGIINKFSMLADQSGTATVTVKAVDFASYAGPSSATDISNGGETMTGTVSKTDTTLSGWTYAGINAAAGWLPPNSIVCFTLSNPSNIIWLQGNIQILEGR
jgi:hypothetical protein